MTERIHVPRRPCFPQSIYSSMYAGQVWIDSFVLTMMDTELMWSDGDQGSCVVGIGE